MNEQDEIIETIEIKSEENFFDYLTLINSKTAEKNPKAFIFQTSSLSKAAASSEIYTAIGYDSRKILERFNTTFNYFFDSRINIGVPYYTENCEYTKYIDIPKGYSVVIPPGKPPISIMSGLLEPLNMGYQVRA